MIYMERMTIMRCFVTFRLRGKSSRIPFTLNHIKPNLDIAIHMRAGGTEKCDTYPLWLTWTNPIQKGLKSLTQSFCLPAAEGENERLRERVRVRECPTANPIARRRISQLSPGLPCGGSLTTNNYFHPAKSFFKVCSCATGVFHRPESC